MDKKILLLDANYQVQRFINLKRALKHIYKEKVEILSFWDSIIYYGSGSLQYPSILRLLNPIKRNYFNTNFSRIAVVKRDKSCCQYCDKKLSAGNITIDHIIPRVNGGKTNFINCVVACQGCNNKKAAMTPEQAGLRLLKEPFHPVFTTTKGFVNENEDWHQDWSNYINY